MYFLFSKGSREKWLQEQWGYFECYLKERALVVMEAYSKLIGVYGEIQCLEPIFEDGLDWILCFDDLQGLGMRERGVKSKIMFCRSDTDCLLIGPDVDRFQNAFSIVMNGKCIRMTFLKCIGMTFSWNDFQETSCF